MAQQETRCTESATGVTAPLEIEQLVVLWLPADLAA